jgi:hypothetical protein
MVGVMGLPLLFGVLSRRSSKAFGDVVGADVETVVDAEGQLGETGAGPVADRLPNSLVIHAHMVLSG